MGQKRTHCDDGCVTARQGQEGMRSGEGGCETSSKDVIGEDFKFLYLSNTKASSSEAVKPEHLRASTGHNTSTRFLRKALARTAEEGRSSDVSMTLQRGEGEVVQI